MKRILEFLILPQHVSDFERRYLLRLNRVALVFFAMHVPVFALIAWCNDTRPWLAAALTSAVLAGPAIAYFTVENPRTVSVVHGVAAMFMGGLLVHFGQGPVQIEMHFYFFALVAMCAVFGNPVVIVAATVTVALHHLVVWLALPRSVFNYEAAWWVVAVHAAFVVLEAVATCFISRSFFDNVIGLEKIVQSRTEALDAKNRDMRLLLDNVQQGFLTIDRQGILAQERSAAVDNWFGVPAPSATLFDYLAVVSPEFAKATRMGWGEVSSDFLPLELALDQMPHRVRIGSTHLRVDYRPIGAAEPYERFLVIVTDVTTEVEREQAESERREAMAVFERVLVDRSGCESFFEEGSQAVELLSQGACDFTLGKRMLHTLKGNASLYGLSGVAAMCHELEDVIEETGELPPPSAYRSLAERWGRLTSEIEKLLGRSARMIEIDDAQYMTLLGAVQRGEPKDVLLKKVRGLRLEPTLKRLHHFAEQAQRIAQRLDKELDVRVEDHGVRVSSKTWSTFWGSFIHAVRNAIDHGIESPEARVAGGKPSSGALTLSTFEDGDRLVVEVVDDGRGIDWDAVAHRASAAGLPADTRDDLQRALFSDGLSTAASVTDVSGRGVGMGSLLQGVHSLGGEMAVLSEGGIGTRLRMTFPLSASSRGSSLPPTAMAAE
jgi:two-component system, chemotaxis family, sensor kinase CheA